MKTAAKVFIILSMIVQAILIYPIVIGALAIKKLNSATSVEELKTMSILTLIFVNTIAGIIMLCMKDGDLQGGKKQNEIAGSVEED